MAFPRAILVSAAMAPFFVFCWAAPTSAQVKENLDLPFDALGDDEEEEDAPEVVNFYSTNLEGDGFFYVVDRSGSSSSPRRP